MVTGGISPEMYERYGWQLDGDSWVNPGMAIGKDQKRKLVKVPKTALPKRPHQVYCVEYVDGHTKVWFDKGPWERLRRKVNAETWLAPLSSASDVQPRFFVGDIDWWAWYDTTKDENG